MKHCYRPLAACSPNFAAI